MKKLIELSSGSDLKGGIYSTIRPIECLKYADITCIGKSEKILVKLIIVF